MEKSIKRVEKLVHATSSALAQMKFSLMFDELNGGKDGEVGRSAEGFDTKIFEKFLDTDDLNLRQNEFMLQASEALAKLDKMSAPNEWSGKNLKPIDRIKEINRQINHLKQDLSKRGETRQSRQKLLSLISEEKFSPGVSSCKDSTGSKQSAICSIEKEAPEKFHSAPRKTASVLAVTKSPIKSKAELKNRILETQVIVDRGFQTARLLAHKVESMTKWDKKDRTPSTGKTVSEINLKSLEGKTESSEAIKTVKCRRHFEKNQERKKKLREVEKINTRVVDIKRNELETDPRFNLQLQHLPSLHIKGALKMQKIHNLEIPASEEICPEKSNTAISFFSHEQMEREKMEILLKKFRKENCGCLESSSRTNYVECFNCGKLIKVRETWVNHRKIDEVLRKCNFNVFDPRIDEFVEKYGSVDRTNLCERSPSEALVLTDVVGTPDLKVPSKVNKEIPQRSTREEPEKGRLFTLRDLSDQLCKRYREEADALADNHLKLDTTLQDIFRKMEESRDIFEAGNLFRNLKSFPGKGPELTVTKPVLVTLPGVSLLVKNEQESLDKKDVINRCKGRFDALGDEEFIFSFPFLSKSFKEKKEGNIFFASSTWESKLAKPSGVNNYEEDKSPSLRSHSSHSSSSSYKPEFNIKGKKMKKTLIIDSVQKKSTNLKNKSLVRLPTEKSKMTKLPENKKEEKEKERAPSTTSSTSSGRSKKTSQMDFKVRDAKKDTEVKGLSTSPVQLNSANHVFIRDVSSSKSSNAEKNDEEKEKVELRQMSSDKSENNYESDFESFTNEQEERENYCEDEELEMNLKKLSTISEVDSEQEKKVSDDQKTSCFEGERNVECVKQKEDSSVASSASVRSKKTARIPTKTEENTLKGAPTELVASLKDILSALQDQFARTESLAEKLTESSEAEGKKKSEPEMNLPTSATLNPWKLPTAAELVENLQSSRKDWSLGPKPSLSLALPEKKKMFEEVLSAEVVSEEGGSSLGEIILLEKTKNNSGVSNSSSISEESILNLGNADRLSLASSGRREMVISPNLNLIS